MYKGGSSRIFPILLVLILVIISIIALVAVGRALFGGSTNDQGVSATTRRALLTTDADHSIRMTVRGPLVAEEQFRSYRVDISPVNRTLTTFGGYLYRTLENKQYTNSAEAYLQLVYALDKVSFLKEVAQSDEEADTRGVCATGRLYTFELMEAQSSIKRLWTSSCKEAKGSFRGDAAQARALLLNQIPESDTMLRKIDLSL